MDRKSAEVHVDKTDARAGSTPHIVRYVLFISLALAIVALSVIWMTGAATNTDTHDNEVVEQAVVAEQNAE